MYDIGKTVWGGQCGWFLVSFGESALDFANRNALGTTPTPPNPPPVTRDRLADNQGWVDSRLGRRDHFYLTCILEVPRSSTETTCLLTYMKSDLSLVAPHIERSG